MSKVIKPKSVFGELLSNLILSLLLVFILWILFVKAIEIAITVSLVVLSIYIIYSFIKKLIKST